MLYFDTSALVKLCVLERESEALRTWAIGRSEDWFTSAITEVELPRAIARVRPEAVDDALRLLERCDRLEVDRIVRELAASLTSAGVRTLDAIHLATALETADDVTAFVCYDNRLGEAAKQHGMSVAAPG